MAQVQKNDAQTTKRQERMASMRQKVDMMKKQEPRENEQSSRTVCRGAYVDAMERT